MILKNGITSLLKCAFGNLVLLVFWACDTYYFEEYAQQSIVHSFMGCLIDHLVRQ